MKTLPPVPDNDADFTPELARKIIGKYQAIVKFLRSARTEPVQWVNECDKTVPQALRFLASNDRPAGGEQSFNSVHLEQLADEIDKMAARPLYVAPPLLPALPDSIEPEAYRIRQLFEPSEGDKEDLITYAREVASLRASTTIDESMIKRALSVKHLEYIQGFNYGGTNVVRDVYKPRGQQELWRGGTHDEMMDFIESERMRRRLEAALSAT